jgi:hypothetical protein
MEYIVHNANKRHEPLRISSTPKVTLLRKRYLANTEKLVKTILVRCGLSSKDPDLIKLVMSLASALELDVLAQSRTDVEAQDGITTWQLLRVKHDANAAFMKAELLAIKPDPSTGAVLHADDFNDLISRWIDHVRRVEDPDAMDETSPDDADPLPYQHLGASQAELEEAYPEAMHDFKGSPPEYIRECLGKPTITKASECLKISEEMRAEGLGCILLVMKSSNEAAKNRSKEHLVDYKALLYFAQKQESGILDKLADDFWISDDGPNENKIEEMYCEQINKKVNIFAILAKFVKKVKKFHQKISKVMKKFGDKVAKQAGITAEELKLLVNPIAHGRDARSAPPPPSLPHQEVMVGFANAFLELNLGMSALYNAGQPILSPEQMQVIAQWLDARIMDGLNAKFSGQQMTFEESYTEYVSACNDALGYLKTTAGFADAVQQYRSSQS